MRGKVLSQRQWRSIGLMTVSACGVMAWYGTRPGFRDYAWNVLAVYWGLFFLFLLLTLYMVLLDFRYIHLEFKLHERALFEDTLASEALRKEIREGQSEGKAPSPEPSEPDAP